MIALDRLWFFLKPFTLPRFPLIQSEKHFRLLAESIPQMVWTATPSGVVDYNNQKWYEFTGLDPLKGRGDVWLNLVHVDDRDRIVKHWQKAVRTAEPYEIEVRFRRAKDGEYRWILVRALPLRDPSGHIVKWFGTNTDIHDQKKKEHEAEFIAKLSRQFSTSLNPDQTLKNLSQGVAREYGGWCHVYVRNEQGQIRLATVSHENPELEKAAVDFDLRFPLLSDGRAGVPQVLRTRQSALIQNMTSDFLGAISPHPEWLKVMESLNLKSMMAAPIMIRGEVRGVLSVVSADRVYQKRDLEMVEEVALQGALALDNAFLFLDSQRAIAARDEFLSIASHELKTPLTSLYLAAQIQRRNIDKVEKSVINQESVLRFNHQVHRQVQRLVRVVDDMLDVSRIRSGNLTLRYEHFDLSALIKDVLERMRPEILQHLGGDPRTEIEDSVFCDGDPSRVEQVLVNLISNAIRYGNSKPITVTLIKQKDVARIVIQDQGIGIAPEDQEKIFNRFERVLTGQGIRGLGLGLFISKQIVEMHQGRIGVESELRKGSQFFFEIPLSAKPSL